MLRILADAKLCRERLEAALLTHVKPISQAAAELLEKLLQHDRWVGSCVLFFTILGGTTRAHGTLGQALSLHACESAVVMTRTMPRTRPAPLIRAVPRL